jgi:hypothetical protein
MKRILYFLLCSTLPFSFLFSQPDHSQRPAMERIESYKKVRLIEYMKLDETQSIKLFARYTKHRDAMKGIEKKRSDLIEKLDGQIKANTADGEYEQTFTELFDLEKEVSEARHNFMGELKQIFTDKQIAEYLIFERNFAKELRDAARDVQQEKMRRRP